MEYSKIISITGLGGLFELLSSKGDGAIVRSLEDNSSKFVSSRVHNFSHLESIEIYTTGENVNLVEVLNAMKSSSTSLPSEKDNAAVKKYFQEVFPEMDFERVYNSDMKKMVKWYGILTKNNIAFEIRKQEEAVVDAPETEETEPVEEKKAPAKKPAAKKETKTKKEVNDEAVEETPKKKAPAKKTAAKKEAEGEKKAAPAKKAAPKKKAKE